MEPTYFLDQDRICRAASIICLILLPIPAMLHEAPHVKKQNQFVCKTVSLTKILTARHILGSFVQVVGFSDENGR